MQSTLEGRAAPGLHFLSSLHFSETGIELHPHTACRVYVLCLLQLYDMQEQHECSTKSHCHRREAVAKACTSPTEPCNTLDHSPSPQCTMHTVFCNKGMIWH